MEKAEYEDTERAKAWYEAKAKEKAEISRITDKASEMAEAEAEEEARVTEKSYAAKRAAEEAAAEIIVKVESEISKRPLVIERRKSKAEAYIKEIRRRGECKGGKGKGGG